MGKSLLERYESGDRRGVWSELRLLGQGVFDEDVIADARAVADRTMERAAQNIATLYERLSAGGYRFARPYDWNRGVILRGPPEANRRLLRIWGGDGSWLDGDANEYSLSWHEPDETTLHDVDWAIELVGPLPLAIEAFWRRVGSADLSGSFPDWNPSAYAFDDEDGSLPPGITYSDPVECGGPERIVDYFNPERGSVTLEKRGQQRIVQLAADDTAKAGLSGGCYTILVPDPVADPILHGPTTDRTFVEHLRHCFEWGGFPGFANTTTVPPQLADLRDGLLPI